MPYRSPPPRPPPKRLYLKRRHCVRCEKPDLDDLAWLDDTPTAGQG